MKLLMIFADHFAWNPQVKSLKSALEASNGNSVHHVIVAFIHAEAGDEEREKSVLTKLTKNLKWLSKKLGTKKVVLHSFAHLSNSKASPEFVQRVFADTEKKLKKVGFEVWQTPFGYFVDLDLTAPGMSLARVFKDI